MHVRLERREAGFYGVPVLRREPKRRLALARIFTSYGFFFLFGQRCSVSDRSFFCKQIIAAVFQVFLQAITW